MDITRFCDAKALEYRTDVLKFIPRCDRERLIEQLMVDYRRENRLAQVAHAPLPAQQRLPPQRLHEGIKTSLTPKPIPTFSQPSSFGAANSCLLQKQRKAERKALKDVTRQLDKGKIGRQLPW